MNFNKISYFKILLYIALVFIGFISKIESFNYVLVLASFLLDLVFSFSSNHIESINFSLSNTFYKRLIKFLIGINLEFNIIFILIYFNAIFKFLGNIYLYLILFPIFTIVIFSLYIVQNLNSETLIFKKAVDTDREKVLELYLDGAKALKEDGVDQWQDKYYPSLKDVDEHLLKDLYVLEYKDEIVSTACLVEGIDEDYEKIQGSWNTKSPYISIHKVATKNGYKKQNFAKKLMIFIEMYARKKKFNLRIDTHEDNKKMRNFILKCGYNHCGVVYLHNELKRLAYDKKII